ncbi:tail protein X [Fusobacterium varium]|uniref:tail protein X n=1 Tax=Fusobacterium varium TaxID=856 RepID=UPI00242E8611|nr:tail protein X [Fusobacterium varium]
MADKKYITILGDTWDSIAYKIYGDSKAYNTLLELNQEYIDVIVFDAGKIINYKEENTTYEADVPPWRR